MELEVMYELKMEISDAIQTYPFPGELLGRSVPLQSIPIHVIYRDGNQIKCNQSSQKSQK